MDLLRRLNLFFILGVTLLGYGFGLAVGTTPGSAGRRTGVVVLVSSLVLLAGVVLAAARRTRQYRRTADAAPADLTLVHLSTYGGHRIVGSGTERQALVDRLGALGNGLPANRLNTFAYGPRSPLVQPDHPAQRQQPGNVVFACLIRAVPDHPASELPWMADVFLEEQVPAGEKLPPGVAGAMLHRIAGTLERDLPG